MTAMMPLEAVRLPVLDRAHFADVYRSVHQVV
jgi:hypothetical protein